MTSPSTNRRRGRPVGDDDANLRERLLESAERLFAEQGYAATPVRAVAEAADVNPALVSYYFGGKQGLLEAVFERVLEPMATAMQGLVDAPEASPFDLLDLLHRLGSEHPNLLPLLMREALLPGGHLEQAFADRFAPRLGGRVPELVRHAQANGRLAADADPEALTVLILSMGVFPFVAANLARRVLGLDLAGADRERLSRQIRQLLSTGVLT